MLRPHSPTEDPFHFNHAQVEHPFGEYSNYSWPPAIDPRSADLIVISEGIVRIVEVEGPVVAKRVFDIYLRSCGIRRMGHELKSTMNKALNHAIREGILVSEKEVNETDLVFSVVGTTGTPPIKLRSRAGDYLRRFRRANYKLQQISWRKRTGSYLAVTNIYVRCWRFLIQSDSLLSG